MPFELKFQRLTVSGVWRNRDDARAGGTGPWHRKARAAGGKLYENIVFSTWKMTISDQASAFSFEPWND